MAEFDIEERRDRSPWVLGLIVGPDHRGTGIGRALTEHLTQWSTENGIPDVWVATGDAEGFYSRCGWTETEKLVCAAQGQYVTILRKTLT